MEIKTIQPFLRYFDNVRERTLRVARCIPPDRVDWSYAPDKFTLGDLLRHLAVAERYMWAENVQGHASRYSTQGPELAASLEEIFAFMARLHAESIAIFGKLTDEDLARKCTTPGGELSTAKWLRAMVEHEVHHRGQVYIYLAMLGAATPPIFGLTSEEVRAHSVAPSKPPRSACASTLSLSFGKQNFRHPKRRG
jgi:uncharacterized damage-inducible protein DinB